ncbi:MAG TPA: type II toxin-antitoxin system PemK/MazF family toxin [Candidatus Saccharimonadales bacterium]|jgi:mRNA interferase MazF|nr:type II toxin-antitoxin system PemK/MazF family toxin [Candidatus Saccharimonadales bacterium]
MSSNDFAKWHFRKTLLHNEAERPFFHEREVWWAAIGQNIGDEEYGKGSYFARPVLIIKKFNNCLFYALPLSTSLKSGRYYRILNVKGVKNTVLLSHMRDYDAKRLLDKMSTVSMHDFQEIKLAMTKLLLEKSGHPSKILYPRTERG